MGMDVDMDTDMDVDVDTDMDIKTNTDTGHGHEPQTKDDKPLLSLYQCADCQNGGKIGALLQLHTGC